MKDFSLSSHKVHCTRSKQPVLPVANDVNTCSQPHQAYERTHHIVRGDVPLSITQNAFARK